MRAKTNRALLLILAGLSLAILGSTGARAELGAISTGAPPNTAIQVYQAEIIGDDPVPIGNAWHVLSPGQPGRIVLNPGGEANGDGQPSILRNPTAGLALVAWSRNSASGYDVVISRFDNGAWTDPQVVAGTPANELDPQLVLDPDGSVHLFFWVEGATPQVLYTHAPADLSAWSAPIAVSQTGEPAARPAGIVHGGVLRVAYEVHDFGWGNTPREVVLARYESGGFVPEVVAMTNNLNEVRPQVHSHAGKMWVDWVDDQTTGGSGEVGWTRLDTLGHWEPIKFEAFGDPLQRMYLTRGGVRMLAIQ